MRFSFPLVFLLSTFLSQASGRALQPVKRSTSDVCAEVHAGVTIPGLLGLPPITIGVLGMYLVTFLSIARKINLCSRSLFVLGRDT